MTQIVGRQSTGNINQKNIPIDLSPQIYKLWPSISPFLTLSQALPSTSCMQPKFEWFDNDDRPDTDTVNGAIDNVTTTLVVDDGTKFLPEETCIIVDKTTGAYGEHIRITAVSGNNLTIVRGVDGTTAAAIADEDIVYNISDAQTEASDLPQAIAVKLNDNFSYTQIIRTVTEYSKTFMRTDLIVDPKPSTTGVTKKPVNTSARWKKLSFSVAVLLKTEVALSLAGQCLACLSSSKMLKQLVSTTLWQLVEP